MIKKYKWPILLLLIIIALIVIVCIFTRDDSKCIQEINLSEVTDKIENEKDFILYIKQTDCTHCKAFTPNFISVLNENGIKAYSLNISNLSEQEQEEYDDLFDVDGTPTVLFFNKGKESLIRIEGEQTKAKIESKIETAGFVKDK